MMPKRIILPLYFDCDNCGKHIEIDVPYVFNSTQKDDGGCIHDIYIKDRVENIDNLCKCESVKKQFEDEYKKMDLNYSINHKLYL